MPKKYNPVRPPSENVDNRPARVFPLAPGSMGQDFTDAPYPGDLNEGNGASKGYNPKLSPTMGSNNVPKPSNIGPTVTADGDGKNGLAG